MGFEAHRERTRGAHNFRKPLQAGIIGLGTVGTGAAEQLLKGAIPDVELKRTAVSDPSKPRDIQVPSITKDAREILTDPDINIVIEVMGGQYPAKEYILEALQAGKSVVTANKAVMARHARELFGTARSNKANLAFEASVGGGIPIIRTINGYKGERVKKVMGILNGTTNYILTLMRQGQNFETALKQAQEKGFAEANHILDTGGFDTRDKLAVLAMLIYNTQIDPEKIQCEGITDITPVDINFADVNGYIIKLLAVADKKDDGSIALRVNPALVRKDHPLAKVDYEVNAIQLETEFAGALTFQGRGAGRYPTTSAVLSDISHVAYNIRHDVTDDLPTLSLKTKYAKSGDIEQRGYFRMGLVDKPGSLLQVVKVFSRHGLSIGNSLQQEQSGFRVNGEEIMPDVITVKPAKTKVIKAALKEIEGLDRVHGKPFFMPFGE